ncbi:MAG: DUF2510 domain-containing protein [Actinomycetota bacterium]|nr:DUF2510 domain-containing protein [Actinomycetota bacterium]
MRRGTKFTVMVIAVVGAAVVLANALASSVDAAKYSTFADYDQARQSAGRGGAGIVVLVMLVIFGFVCKKIGYRGHDTFLQLIPIAGIYFMVKFMWRWASLPDEVYWTVAPSGNAPAIPGTVPPGMYQVPGEPSMMMYWDGGRWSGQKVPSQPPQPVAPPSN